MRTSFHDKLHVGAAELHVCKKYALLTKRKVKIAGYWPSSFLRPRRSRGP